MPAGPAGGEKYGEENIGGGGQNGVGAHSIFFFFFAFSSFPSLDHAYHRGLYVLSGKKALKEIAE